MSFDEEEERLLVNVQLEEFLVEEDAEEAHSERLTRSSEEDEGVIDPRLIFSLVGISLLVFLYVKRRTFSPVCVCR